LDRDFSDQMSFPSPDQQSQSAEGAYVVQPVTMLFAFVSSFFYILCY